MSETVQADNADKSTLFDHFPLSTPRETQTRALQFIQDMIGKGITDIVIEAPTGAGKSAIGAAVCDWASTWPSIDIGDGQVAYPGGYYLVTQLMLQDQIADDAKNNFNFRDFCSLKSADSYECDLYGRCNIGLQVKEKVCDHRKENHCPYIMTRAAFGRAHLSVTNYPYFITERIFVGKLPARNVIVCDECHTLERTLLKFGEIVLSQKLLKDIEIRNISIPEYEDMSSFISWLEEKYLPILQERELALKLYLETDPMASKNEAIQKRYTAISNQVQRIVSAITGARSSPGDWVYWTDETEKEGLCVYLKPLNAVPYMDIIRGAGVVRIYMSAYPGEKKVFCRNLGLDPEEVAWIKLRSTFPIENRPVVMAFIGSMSKKNKNTTFPQLVHAVDKIMRHHGTQKGIIHCNSYALGQEIVDKLSAIPAHANRILFPKNADERKPIMEKHAASTEPTVIISPSITEGFDFKFDLASWQIIAKMPYPYLGDLQVARKKEIDPEWYALQTASTIIQACGRIVRDEKDKGVTYILDQDFLMLWDRYEHFFPKWFKDAISWPSNKK